MAKSRTPLRYPGGKQKIWHFIDEVIAFNNLSGCHYIEPYAGGAGVAIELLLSDRVSRIHINDSCSAVFSFWDSILTETERFCRKISRASLTIDEWKRQREVFRNRETADRFDLGYAMFYLNRCNRSGIVTGGVIGGLEQTGRWKIDARFPRNELIGRIETIAEKGGCISVSNMDAEAFMRSYVPKIRGKKIVYCDPPYFRKADRLYPNHYLPKDHARIAEFLKERAQFNWLISYDSCQEILELYEECEHFEYMLQYHAATSYQGSELFAFGESLEIPFESVLPFIDRAIPV